MYHFMGSMDRTLKHIHCLPVSASVRGSFVTFYIIVIEILSFFPSLDEQEQRGREINTDNAFFNQKMKTILYKKKEQRFIRI